LGEVLALPANPDSIKSRRAAAGSDLAEVCDGKIYLVVLNLSSNDRTPSIEWSGLVALRGEIENDEYRFSIAQTPPSRFQRRRDGEFMESGIGRKPRALRQVPSAADSVWPSPPTHCSAWHHSGRVELLREVDDAPAAVDDGVPDFGAELVGVTPRESLGSHSSCWEEVSTKANCGCSGIASGIYRRPRRGADPGRLVPTGDGVEVVGDPVRRLKVLLVMMRGACETAPRRRSHSKTPESSVPLFPFRIPRGNHRRVNLLQIRLVDMHQGKEIRIFDVLCQVQMGCADRKQSFAVGGEFQSSRLTVLD